MPFAPFSQPQQQPHRMNDRYSNHPNPSLDDEFGEMSMNIAATPASLGSSPSPFGVAAHQSHQSSFASFPASSLSSAASSLPPISSNHSQIPAGGPKKLNALSFGANSSNIANYPASSSSHANGFDNSKFRHVNSKSRKSTAAVFSSPEEYGLDEDENEEHDGDIDADTQFAPARLPPSTSV
jgi:hypothetical protein